MRRALSVIAVAASLLIGVGAANAAGNVDSDRGGRFIVTVRPGADPRATAAEYNRRNDVTVDYVYTVALHGFAGDFSSGAMGDLARDGRIDRIERDGVVHATTDQAGATWGIDRIDQHTLPLSGTYSYGPTGAGVTAYIIDTGIRTTHAEFGGRASSGYDFVDNDTDASDCNGHGTHVAGTIGGSTYGVAKAVNLVAVRVLSCQGSGSWSGVAAGIDWVAAHHSGPSVANMSLGGGISSLVDTAVTNAVASGVTFAVAAGNSSANACNYSPARVPTAVTVGATTSTDARASYSNYGTCLDLFAPGSSITSSWNTNDTATNTISGTSMATPHVAGVAALILDENPSATTTEVRDALVNGATPNLVTSAGTGSPNRLLYTDAPVPVPPVGDPPVVTLAKSCTGTRTCTFNATGDDPDGGTVTLGWTGASSTSPTTASATYNSPGTYTVTVTGTDDEGATASASKSVSCVWNGRGSKKTLACT